jgi:hypothetical protein
MIARDIPIVGRARIAPRAVPISLAAVRVFTEALDRTIESLHEIEAAVAQIRAEVEAMRTAFDRLRDGRLP